jgi:hypothetical protein
VAAATVEANSCNVAPAQIGPPFDADGAAGAALTIAVVVPCDDVHPLTVAVTA